MSSCHALMSECRWTALFQAADDEPKPEGRNHRPECRLSIPLKCIPLHE